jgi:hypothetical protein
MNDINDSETPIPEAPKGAATPPLDPTVTQTGKNQDSERYLNNKGMLTSEGMINAFRELQESDDPINAILITELQEVKQMVARLAQMSSLSVCLLAAACAIMIYQMKGKE